MSTTLTRRLTFALERWIQKGIGGQLLLMLLLIVLVASSGGALAWAATDRFTGLGEAVWWAFLRLTDPGYLGDDEGLVLRTISTCLTVLGYVIFMGSLIAIMTQWLALTMRRFESGATPIAMKGHAVVLGWTNRTPEICAMLLGGRGRLTRFLQRRRVDRLRLVVLAEQVDAALRQQLRDHLGPLWNDNQVFLRSGSSLQPEHLDRLDIGRASVVIVPGSDFELGGAELTDARVVKTLLTLRNAFRPVPPDDRPHVVAELFDVQKSRLARGTLGGCVDLVTSDVLVSRLMHQTVRQRGLAPILLGILSHRRGHSLYLRSFPEFTGHAPSALHRTFGRAVVLGLVRREGDRLRAVLDPQSTEPLAAGDLLVLLAESYADCRLVGPPPEAPRRVEGVRRLAERTKDTSTRVLVLGWSYKIRGLLGELAESQRGRFDVTIVSRVPIAEREVELATQPSAVDRLHVRHVEADYTAGDDLAGIDPSGFEHVLFLASSLVENVEQADARTVLGFALVQAMLAEAPRAEGSARPELLVELLDPANAHLFAGDHGFAGDADGVVLVSPRVVSHVLAHIAMRPELAVVFDELFGSGGTDFELVSAAELDLADRDVRFADVQAAAVARGCVALGLARRVEGRRDVQFNPDRATTWRLTARDEVVVLVPGQA
jgi:ion channel POLLUX/CASTOR